MTTPSDTRIHLAPTGTEPARTGRQALAGGLLFAAGVALEWVLNPQRVDGTVVRPAVFAALVGSSSVGVALLALSARGLGGLAAGRAVRWGSRFASVGAVLILTSTLVVLVTGLATGAPAAWSFIGWSLGLLLLSIGSVVLGVGLRRAVPAAAALTVVAGLALLASLAVPLDPWHDVALMAFCAAWSLAGLSLCRR